MSFEKTHRDYMGEHEVLNTMAYQPIWVRDVGENLQKQLQHYGRKAIIGIITQSGDVYSNNLYTQPRREPVVVPGQTHLEPSRSYQPVNVTDLDTRVDNALNILKRKEVPTFINRPSEDELATIYRMSKNLTRTGT